MNPVTYIIIRSAIESDSNKVATFVMAYDSAVGAFAKTKDWRNVWPDCTITIERVMWLSAIKQFSSVTIEQSELVAKAKEELESEIEKQGGQS
jgi:hypothetical protein